MKQGVKPMTLNNPTTRGVLLYHGSKGGIRGIVAPISRAECDFGRGFYLGTLREQAYSICLSSDQPRFYECFLNPDGLDIVTLSGMQWMLYVGYNRGELALYYQNTPLVRSMLEALEPADIIIGDIADDSIAPAFQQFLDGLLTDVGLTYALSFMQLGKQHVLKSQRACSQVSCNEVNLTSKEIEALRLFDEDRGRRTLTILPEVARVYRKLGRIVQDWESEGIFDASFKSLREYDL